jgi:14-3-3 protein
MNEFEPRPLLQELIEIQKEEKELPSIVGSLKVLLNDGLSLQEKETKLLEETFKEIITSKRKAWKKIALIEKSDKGLSMPVKTCLSTLMTKIQREIIDGSNELVAILNGYLPKQQDKSTKPYINLVKLRSDLLRYCSECSAVIEERKKFGKEADDSYKEALDLAEEHLPIYEPVRLGIVLNYSLLHYVVYGDVEQAIKLASETQANVLEMLSYDSELLNPQIKAVLQALSDNLTLWKYEIPDEEVEGTPEETDALCGGNLFDRALKNPTSFP